MNDTTRLLPSADYVDLLKPAGDLISQTFYPDSEQLRAGLYRQLLMSDEHHAGILRPLSVGRPTFRLDVAPELGVHADADAGRYRPESFATVSNPVVIAQRLASHRGTNVLREIHDPEAIYDSLLIMALLAQEKPHCLLHADPHIGNTFYTRERPWLVDSRQIRKDCWRSTTRTPRFPR